MAWSWEELMDEMYGIRFQIILKISHKEENGRKYAFVAGTIWFTNMDHGRLHKNYL